MKWMIWLTLTSLVWAVPGGRGRGYCRYSGAGSHGYRSSGYYYGGGSGYGYGYARRARGPELPKVGGTLPGYDNEEAQQFPELNRQQPQGSLAPFTPSPFDPSRTAQPSGTFRIERPAQNAPPGY
ncbi:hypothetical protein ABS71_18820 [bacterium SCN 62-11]|nr:MAG: hypothetical protein ABS71_18820 [bacterium SCN 62-11]